jgi:hypothetical protein
LGSGTQPFGRNETKNDQRSADLIRRLSLDGRLGGRLF